MAQLLWKTVWQFPANSTYCDHPTQQSHSLIFLWGAEHLCLHQNLHPNVSSSFINYCPKLEAAMMFFSTWIDKTTIYSFNEYFSVLKRKLSSHEMTCGNFKCSLLSESPSPSEKSTYYMIPTIWHPGKARLWRQTDPWFPRVGMRKRRIGRVQRFFRVVDNTL